MKSRFSTLNDWLEWQGALHWSTIDLGLGRIRQVAEKMRLFDLSYTVITVAGTNGKGSSVALL
ncbi:MAG TPA: bifunctional folylpolyglutamate synthase/dihydrofolate synthase, partial [Thiothrix sp.]|nr:bifunctional folylpolyglutamate synthase/dihydrofolate synthase [Thiothrix sp.]